MRRLFWRAGFGATPEEVERWTSRGRAATLEWIVDGDGPAELKGPSPQVKGAPLDPENEFGHHVLWWLDRMVRTTRPLEEKLTLFWHDHFATTGAETPLMLRQNRTLREHALGSFPALLREMTLDPALQLFLSLAGSHKRAPNENFARELMELFTLGAGYTENDIREASRALTGFVVVRSNGSITGVRYEPANHDDGVKTILGKTGAFGWEDVLRLVVEHPRHPGFLVDKLWGQFHHVPMRSSTRQKLKRLYLAEGRRIRPVVRRMLDHPYLYKDLGAPPMVKSPVVYVAGMLRTTGSRVDRDAWVHLLASMGQLPFHPPSVAGWEGGLAWMNTNAMRARFSAANELLRNGAATVPEGSVDLQKDTRELIDAARAATGVPQISAHTDRVLRELVASFRALPSASAKDEKTRRSNAVQCQRALRHLLLSGPDGQLH